MSEVRRYLLIEPDGEQFSGYLYDEREYPAAERDARANGCAIRAYVYEYADTEVVWTPDGSDTWPPEPDNN